MIVTDDDRLASEARIYRDQGKASFERNAHERLGYALFKLRRYEDALDNYEDALQFDTEDIAALIRGPQPPATGNPAGGRRRNPRQRGPAFPVTDTEE